MTPLQTLAFASFAGALLFFTAGAAAAALWRARRIAVPEPVIDDQARIHAATMELEAARARANRAETSIAPLTRELDIARARADRAETSSAPLSVELETLRVRAERAEATLVSVRARAEAAAKSADGAFGRADEIEHLRRELAAARAAHQDARASSDELAVRLAVEAERLADSEARAKHLASELERARTASAAGRVIAQLESRVKQLATELDRARAAPGTLAAKHDQLEGRTRDTERRLAERTTAANDLAAKNDQLDSRAKQLATELDRLRTASATSKVGQLEGRTRDTERLLAERTKAEHDLAAKNEQLESRAKQLAEELDRLRTTSVTTGKDVEQLESRARETERLLAERTQALRDLSAANEQLKGRLGDAEALRAEYVRLRTTVTETAFLKAEVARLEESVRSMRRDALGARPARTAATATRGHAVRPTGSIGESLSATLDRFADPNTRGSAVADALGFPLASSGEDGNALAAYAALLLESANRASQLLPMAAPSAIELVDERGARIGVWTFEVERERLVLVTLAVAPVDGRRVESTLAELATILAPTPEGPPR